MTTSLLYDPPTDPLKWLTWGAVHMFDHFQIAQGIFSARQILIPLLPLDPVPSHRPELMLGWFQNHMSMHAAMNAAMGTQGADLSVVDFTNPEQLIVWLEANAAEHLAIAAAIAAFQQLPAQLFGNFAVQPQPLVGTQPQPGGINGLQPQPSPAIQPQPQPAVQTQPNPAIQPQPGLAPGQRLVAGTPFVTGSGQG